MYQFFVENENISGGRIRITGEDVNHIKNVIRLRPGERVRVSSLSGDSFFCHIEQIRAAEVTAVIDGADESGTEFAHRVYLFQGLPKSDKMELIVQKAVELGVYEIIPVEMKNCVAKLDERKAENRVQRWQAIAKSAAKQSRRSVIPEVRLPVSWKEALAMAEEMDIPVLVPYENERGLAMTRELIGKIAPGSGIGVIVGPEGGFDKAEIAEVQANHRCQCISLGRRILRTETAGFALLSMLVYALDE